MGVKVRILGIILFLWAAAPRGYGQTGGGQIPVTDEQQAICNKAGSALTKAECAKLVTEFFRDKSAASGPGLYDSLRDPWADLGTFITGERQRAFQRIAEQNLDTDLSAIAQAALNNAAQALSTKTAVSQTGAAPSSSGSTNLVAKPTTTDLISLAAESGAFTDTLNGNSLTAQVNVNGLRRYLDGKPFADLSPSRIDFLNHINLAATFAVAQSGSTGVPTSGSATSSTPSIAGIILPSNNISFNSFSANYYLYRHYNPYSVDFLSNWKNALNKYKSDLASAISGVAAADMKVLPFREAATKNMDLNTAQAAWISEAKTDENSGDFTQFVTDYTTFANVFEATLTKLDSNFDSDVLAINGAIEALAEINDKVLDEARGTPLLTLSYTYSTPTGKPSAHSATLVVAYVFHRFNAAQLTGNAAGSWFASVPAGAVYGRVQSYQFSGEYDQPIGSKSAPRATFSLAGYGQYQYSPTVLNITSANLAPGTDITLPSNAQVLLGTAGWLGVAQVKLVFNVGKGLSIPVAVKWSNKTDLLPTSNWKGQFGITYDLSAISSMLSGKN